MQLKPGFLKEVIGSGMVVERLKLGLGFTRGKKELHMCLAHLLVKVIRVVGFCNCREFRLRSKPSLVKLVTSLLLEIASDCILPLEEFHVLLVGLFRLLLPVLVLNGRHQDCII